MPRSVPLAGIGLLAVAALSGCASAVSLSPAADAKNTGCAEVVVRLPDVVAGLNTRATDAQGTGAWGEPAGVLLRCGVPVPDPTSTLVCYTVGGVDWLIDPQEESSAESPTYVFTTYGRDPATEVIVDNSLASGRAALTDLAVAVGSIPADRACTDPLDTLE